MTTTDHPLDSERARNYVFGICSRRIENLHDAEDVTQETLLYALGKWSTISDPDHPWGWLKAVTQSRIREFLKKRRARRPHDKAYAADPLRRRRCPAADEQAIRDELAQTVDAALGKIKDLQRTVLEQVVMRGRTARELAAELGYNYAWISVCKRAGLEELRGLLAELDTYPAVAAARVSLDGEELLTIPTLARTLRPAVSHVSVRNWIGRGLRSKVNGATVRLECRQHGGRLYTSMPAYERFAVRVHGERA